jgi:Fic family protein
MGARHNIQKEIISILLANEEMKSSGIHGELRKMREQYSLVTVKRWLAGMADSGTIQVIGSGRATTYKISVWGRISADIDPKRYCAVEPDKRHGLSRYNFELLPNFPADIFDEEELLRLTGATEEYKKRTTNLSGTIGKKELERLIIELSWKSSKIEGNTYTLLDTEKLILENKEAVGHSKEEARMILNHKDAFNYILENAEQFQMLTRKNLEELHSILVKDLSVAFGLREKPVGVLGSVYMPLDNIHQIGDAIRDLEQAVKRVKTPYGKAMAALLGISYIQPFEDGNKRTSRLAANAILLAYGCAPLSYRSVEESDYREAMLVFYELNSVAAFKKIFIGQYEFAAENYAVKINYRKAR